MACRGGPRSCGRTRQGRRAGAQAAAQDALRFGIADAVTRRAGPTPTTSGRRAAPLAQRRSPASPPPAGWTARPPAARHEATGAWLAPAPRPSEAPPDSVHPADHLALAAPVSRNISARFLHRTRVDPLCARPRGCGSLPGVARRHHGKEGRHGCSGSRAPPGRDPGGLSRRRAMHLLGAMTGTGPWRRLRPGSGGCPAGAPKRQRREDHHHLLGVLDGCLRGDGQAHRQRLHGQEPGRAGQPPGHPGRRDGRQDPHRGGGGRSPGRGHDLGRPARLQPGRPGGPVPPGGRPARGPADPLPRVRPPSHLGAGALPGEGVRHPAVGAVLLPHLEQGLRPAGRAGRGDGPPHHR